MSNNAKFKEVIDALDKKRLETGLNLNGKQYATVKDRVESFRLAFGDEFGIDTSVDWNGELVGGTVIVAAAKIRDKITGQVLSSGHATEIVGSNEFTKLSAIETAETSAVGRALAFFGLAGGEFPSGDEMQGVQRKQEAVAEKPNPAPTTKANGTRPVLGSIMKKYLPDGSIEMWDEVSKVVDDVILIEQPGELASYWSTLKEFRKAVEANPDKHMHAELVSAFSTRKAQLGAKQ